MNIFKVQAVLSDLGQCDPERRKRLESQLSVVSSHSSGGGGPKSPSPERISPERRLSKQKSIADHGSVRRTLSTLKEKDGELDADGVKKTTPEKDSKTSGTKLIEIEKAETGSVKWDVYMVYLKANGYILTLLVCLFMMISNAFQVASNVWLADWSNSAVMYGNTTAPDTPERLAGYAGLGLSQGTKLGPSINDLPGPYFWQPGHIK